MKNTAIRNALNDITKAVQALEGTASGTVSWEERYYQEKTDHNDNLVTMQAHLDHERREHSNTRSACNALKVELEAAKDTIEARTDALKGWQKNCEDWQGRFTRLETDMKAWCAIAVDLSNQLDEARKVVVAQRVVINDMQAHS